MTERKSQVTTYTYDPLNRRTKATFQDGMSTNYAYDAGNRIETGGKIAPDRTCLQL